MNNNLISIVVPVYNAGKFIEKTIESVKNQTINNYELILVDDCSKDNSANVIEKYTNDQIKLIRLEKNKGVSNARNVGIKESVGRYVCFLDADDYWLPNKLETQLNFMKENDCVFSFTGYRFVNYDLSLTNAIVRVPKEINYKGLLKNTTIFTSTVMFDLTKITKEEIYFPNIKSEDTGLWLRILRNGIIAKGINETLVYYRRSENTYSSNKKEAVKKMWDLYRNQEKLSLIYSIYNFIFYALNAVRRRI
ncbi:MAG TPA: glycosyltransferase family 2 protein [Bacilli bacterium]|nr:glycosyltransferase family 2 protein [Bacilli bacterium]